MIAGLERFVTSLRDEGIAASPAEWLDAVRSLETLGVDDRARFRQALRCTLVKRRSQHDRFDRVFERFFAAPGRGGTGRERTAGGAAGTRGKRPAGAATDAPLPRRRPPDPGRRREREIDRERPLQETEPLGRTVTSLREGVLRRKGRWRRVVVAQADRRSIEHRPPGERRPDAAIPHPSDRELARRLSTAQEREIAAQVPRIIARIRLRTGRRLRRAARGRLYLRRLFRDNLRHGGVPCVLPRRRRQARRSRVVLMIDVSWSTLRAAGLFLSIAGEFLRHARDTRVLLFVDRAVDATREVQAWLARPPTRPDRGERAPSDRWPAAGIERGGVAFAHLVRSLRGLNLDAPSDYGRAFHALTRSRLRPGGRTTALLVLGDGRTNRFDPQDWAWEEIASRCGAVVWLVPEPVERWETGDSALGAYLIHADVAVEARDLRGLGRGVSELLRRL